METPLNKRSPHLMAALLAVTVMLHAPASHALPACDKVEEATQNAKEELNAKQTEAGNKTTYLSPIDLEESACLDTILNPSALISLTVPSLSGLATNLVTSLIDTVCDEASNLYNTGIDNLNQAISDTLNTDLPYGLGGVKIDIGTGGDSSFNTDDAYFEGEQFINDLYK
jgi:uncharacterized protein YceK